MSQLDAVQSIGVPIDRFLLDALGLVELNPKIYVQEDYHEYSIFHAGG